MSDLVKRLRKDYHYCIGPNCENWELMAEAADEIERLKHELTRWKTVVDNHIEHLEASIEGIPI